MSNWYKQDTQQVLDEFETSAEGLSNETAQQQLEKYGPNELEDKGTRSPWKILIEQFTQTMVLILIAAAIISAFLGDWLEAGAIMAIVVLFGTLGFIQDYRADQAMAALQEMAVPDVQVIREGKEQQLPAVKLVPGDIVLLEAGNVVPADLRLLKSIDLQIDESALTGESEPVDKQTEAIAEDDLALGDRTNMAYNGTVINAGRGKGIVTETGMDTEMGQIATMIQEGDSGQTPMQEQLDYVGKMLAALGVAVAILVAAIGYFFLDQSLRQMFLVAVSLAVAVVPEGLPAVVTMTLALGSQRMLKRHTLIRKLPAVETLGSVTTICTDKTGTLTQNRMTVTKLNVAHQQLDLTEQDQPDQPSWESHQAEPLANQPALAGVLVAGGALCTDARLEKDEEDDRIKTIGDPTEGALLSAATRLGLSYPQLKEQFPRVAELSFDSDRKRMTTVHELPNDSANLPEPLRQLVEHGKPYLAITKGAMDSLLDISSEIWTEEGLQSSFTDEERQHLEDQNKQMSKQGMRVLGLAIRPLESLPDKMTADDETDLQFVGLFGMIDPPRPEVKEAVRRCKTAGIRPIMITGDHPLTAVYIAKDLGISDNDRVHTGQDLKKMSEAELQEAVKQTSVYARVSPADKLEIVKALEAQGEICSMTGDGVNDAPALKRAKIGVAMGITGTDVTKEASDMVLLDDNYATIVAAVEEGRVIGDNVRRFVKYSIAGNIGKVFVMMFAPLFSISLALQPLQLLWLNLITDGLLGLGMSVEPPDKNTMNRPPRKPDEGVFSRGGVRQVLSIGTLIGIIALGVGAWYYQAGRENWQTMIFTLIAFLQVGQALGMRSEHESFFSLGATSNQLLLGLSVGIVALQLAVLYIPFLQTFVKTSPLSLVDLAVCVVFGSLVFIAIEIWKLFRQSRQQTQ